MPADDDEASGPPPHPLDRVWFHPSELGSSVTALRPQPVAARIWVIVAVALIVGITGTLGAVLALGGLGNDARTANPLERASVATGFADPDSVATLVTTVGRSIVTIAATPADGGDVAFTGSGVVVQPNRVLTAAHLLLGQTSISVVTIGGQVSTARVLGVDPETDLALLAVDDADLVLPRLATGDGIRIGTTVAALAAGPSPRRWVSAGVISGINEVAPLTTGVQGVALLETDARFHSTAAGGALLESSGAVIGILTGPDRLAVPIDIARNVAAQIETSGRALHGWAGVVASDYYDRQGGVRVRGLVPESPAEVGTPATGGLLVDDVITTVADTTIGNVGDLAAAFRRLRPGDPVDLQVVRQGKRKTVTITLGTSQPLSADLLVAA